jgi:hypothetical protein
VLLAVFPRQQKIRGFRNENSSSQGQNMALTGLHVPTSLNSGNTDKHPPLLNLTKIPILL